MKTLLFVLAVSMIARAATSGTTLANFPDSMVYAVQTDAAGNVYVAGFQGNFAKANPFVAKLNAAGQILYSTTLAGSGFGIAWALAADSSGAAYVFGNTSSPDFPVTPGALQTTPQGSFQGFVTKLDPAGKIVYSTFLGGATNVTPGMTSAPGLDSILVDSSGDAIITGLAATNPGVGRFPPPPAPSVGRSEYFVLKLDPGGAKILGALKGIGGMIAMDAQGSIYVAGLQYGTANPIPVTPGAFQGLPADVCSSLHAFFNCGYQYVAKLNPGLDQVLYATYLGGKYGAIPAAISVDARGNAWIAGTTSSPDYPATPDAFEPRYVAGAAPNRNCTFAVNCVNLPPVGGYLSEVNPTGTGLIYSTYFSGTQTDTINFAAFTSDAIYLGGNAQSADLPGFAGYPRQCLPQSYQARLSASATEIGPSRVVPGKVLAYDAFAATLIASSGSDVIAVDPKVAQAPVACILDSADLQPVTAIAPGELLSLFGEFSSGSPVDPVPGQVSTTLDGVTVDVNGVPGSLLYVSGGQINFQTPLGVGVGSPATISVASALANLSDSLTLPVAPSNPTAFLTMTTPASPLANCTLASSASVNGLLPLAVNPDGAANTCLNPAAAGSMVSLFLEGLGVTSAPQVTATAPLTVTAVSALPGVISSVWQVSLQIPAGQTAGGVQVSLAAGGVAVRDANLIVWVK